MRRILFLIVLVIACLTVPVLLAAGLSAVTGVGSLEAGILYLLCIVGAVLVWRSFRRYSA